MKRFNVAAEIILIFVVPVLVFYFELIPYGARLAALEIFFAFVVLLAMARKMNFRSLGFRMDTFKASAKMLIPLTVVALVVLFVAYFSDFGTTYFFKEWWKNIYFLYYLILGALTQEFGYRVFLLQRLRSISYNKTFLLLSNSLLFALLHSLHKDWLILAGTFLFGMYLTWVYMKHPNILSSTLAHGIVGATAIILGFF